MDIVEILLPIVALLFSLYLTGRKKRKEDVFSSPPVYDSDEYVEPWRETPCAKSVPIDFFEEKCTIPPKTSDFLNYDELGQGKWEEEKALMKEEEKIAYSFDNELESKLDIPLDIESMRQGFIYAEILKIPYKQ